MLARFDRRPSESWPWSWPKQRSHEGVQLTMTRIAVASRALS
jgi:hypothetical protein